MSGPADRVDSFAADADTSGEGTGAPAGAAGGPQDGKAAPPDIGVIGMLRWAWRQLTTMRVALMLLLLLALAAVPGSLFPQRIQDPSQVAQYIQENGAVGEWLDRLQLFDVYSSIWFSAIYILLMVSLIGCILPRTKVHWQAMRARPPKAPRRLSRMPAYRELELNGDRESVLDAAERILKRRGYRVDRRGDHLAAERGYLRETGNIIFHVALLGIVIAVALGSLFGWSGQRILVEEESFSNSLVSYDYFEPGAYFDPDRLQDFRFRLDEFHASFDTVAEGNQFGQPREFTALVTTTEDGQERQQIMRVNEPVRMDGANVYLVGNGYAPVMTVRDGSGEVVFSGAVTFLPQDGVYTSRGVIKVPDSSPEQLGFVGILLPTVSQDPETGELVSTFADLVNPYMVLSAYAGDLGLDSGIPQSVYSLDPENMRELQDPQTGEPLTLQLREGETAQLPEDLGSVTYEGTRRYVALDIRHDPVQGVTLVFSVLAFLGLTASLFVPRRRAWIRVASDSSKEPDDAVRVEVAALARGDDPRLRPEVSRLVVELQSAVPK
ncbi:cytochrome c biogenesis protein ResB [Sediminivirga luteola]|uniref:cytochrome c biogenesis protein ResB n=1 Tax=Sediminivirga luteola TaxID=1774748 RepID=UPI001F5AB72F|nr:cytochrome c biogenesis protein ResB [Sediminivirga luteola]MCI2264726.1 cytochrome c biogenesis protein ResB [Sediminivirga luteola]